MEGNRGTRPYVFLYVGPLFLSVSVSLSKVVSRKWNSPRCCDEQCVCAQRSETRAPVAGFPPSLPPPLSFCSISKASSRPPVPFPSHPRRHTPSTNEQTLDTRARSSPPDDQRPRPSAACKKAARRVPIFLPPSLGEVSSLVGAVAPLVCRRAPYCRDPMRPRSPPAIGGRRTAAAARPHTHPRFSLPECSPQCRRPPTPFSLTRPLPLLSSQTHHPPNTKRQARRLPRRRD